MELCQFGAVARRQRPLKKETRVKYCYWVYIPISYCNYVESVSEYFRNI